MKERIRLTEYIIELINRGEGEIEAMHEWERDDLEVQEFFDAKIYWSKSLPGLIIHHGRDTYEMKVVKKRRRRRS